MERIESSTKALLQDFIKKHGYDASKIANRMGWQLSRTKYWLKVLEKENLEEAVFTEKHGGYGRPEMRCYIVARRHVNKTWARQDSQAIEQARRLYDEGKSEMATGRDGRWIILYSIPRNSKAIRTNSWFGSKRGVNKCL